MVRVHLIKAAVAFSNQNLDLDFGYTVPFPMVGTPALWNVGNLGLNTAPCT